MKSLKKSVTLVVAVSTLAGTVGAEANNIANFIQDKYCDPCDKATIIITQRDVTNAGGNFVLEKSGNYGVACDIKGRLTIDADNVCLDLCCHEIDAEGASSAISTNNETNVIIKNGSVVNSSSAGISFSNCEDVDVEGITFRNHTEAGLLFSSCKGIKLSDGDFSLSNRAFVLESCQNGKIDCCELYNNINTTVSLVGIKESDCVSVTDVKVCDNIHNISANQADPACGLFTVIESSNVNLLRVHVNNNSQPVSGFFAPLFISQSVNCTVVRSETNGNTNLDTGLGGTFLAFTNNVEVTDSEMNGNSTTADTPDDVSSSVLSAGLFTLRCDDTVITGCIADDNTIRNGFISGICPFLNRRTIIRNCITNNNVQTNREIQNSGGAAGIFVEGFIDNGDVVIISHCQTNGNGGNARGHGIVARIAAHITDCQANNNFSRGDFYTAFNEAGGTWGIRYEPGIFNPPADPPQDLAWVIERCETHNNTCEIEKCVGIGAGNFEGFNVNLRITESVAIGNTSTTNNAFGILIEQSPQAVIKDCQVYNTKTDAGSQNFVAGIGIVGNIENSDDTIEDICVQNCQVYNTIATNEADAAGILVRNGLGCKISECTAQSTQSGSGRADGIRLEGTTNNSIVKDSIALKNGTAGFANLTISPAALFENESENTFVGNMAEANGTGSTADNYFEIPDGNIETFDKSTGNISGTPNRWTNLSIIPED